MTTALSTVNLNRLVVFAAVVDAGSMTGAASRLGLAKTMVSTHMQRLERELGANLLVRTTRNLRLTPAGERFHRAILPVLQQAEEAVDSLGLEREQPRGTLRITSPIDYGASVMAPLVVELQRRHPSLRIELLTVDRQLDLVSEGVDVAIRLGRLADSALQSVRIGSFDEWLVASPGLLPRNTRLRDPRDLERLPFIALSVLLKPLIWVFEKKGRKRTASFSSSLSVNTAHAARAAVLAGRGLGVLSRFDAEDDVAAGRLVRVLPEWSLPGGGIYAVFPATRYRPLNTRVLIDALRARIAAGAQ